MSQTVAALNFKIVADAGDFVDGVALTKKELREAAKIADQTSGAFSKLAAERAKLDRLVAGGALSGSSADLHMSRFSESLGLKKVDGAFRVGLEKDIGDLTKATNNIPFAFDPATAAIAAFTAVVGTAGVTVHERIKALDDLGDAAERLGVSASSLSLMRNAAFLGDVDPAMADTMLQKLLVNVGKGADVFEDIGLDVEKLRELSPMEIFSATADAISKLPNKAEQFSAMAEAMGKSSPEAAKLVERFSEMREIALKSGALVPDDLVAKAGSLDDSFKRIALNAEGWGNALVATVEPSIAQIANTIDAAGQDGGRFQNAFKRVMRKVPGGAFILGSMFGEAVNDKRSGIIDAARADIGERADIDAAIQAGDIAGDRAKNEDKVAMAIDRQHEAMSKVLQDMRDELQLLEATNAEREAFRMARMGGDADAQQEAADLRDQLDMAKSEQQRQRKQQSDELAAQVDKAERAASLRESIKSPLAKSEDFARGLFGLGLGDGEIEKLLMKEARGLVGDGGLRGPPAADKGTAAAREAVLGAQAQQEQSKLQREMAKHLRKLAERKPAELLVVSE